MIVIRIKNVKEIVARERGFWAARFGSFFTDLERKVEEEVVQQIAAAFAERKIEADISIIKEDPPTSGGQV